MAGETSCAKKTRRQCRNLKRKEKRKAYNKINTCSYQQQSLLITITDNITEQASILNSYSVSVSKIIHIRQFSIEHKAKQTQQYWSTQWSMNKDDRGLIKLSRSLITLSFQQKFPNEYQCLHFGFNMITKIDTEYYPSGSTELWYSSKVTAALEIILLFFNFLLTLD